MGGQGGVEIHAGGGALSPVPQWPFPSCTPPGAGAQCQTGQGSGFAREAKVPGGSRQPSADGCCCRQT